MSKLKATFLAQISSWFETMQDGDKIVRRGNTINFYNSSGCLLDSIQL